MKAKDFDRLLGGVDTLSADQRWRLRQALAAPGYFYGADGTIHSTTQVDVGVDGNGQVSAVWFRCALLPFRQYNAEESGAGQGNPDTKLVGVEFVD